MLHYTPKYLVVEFKSLCWLCQHTDVWNKCKIVRHFLITLFFRSPPTEDVSTSTAGHLVHLMFLIFVCVFGTIGNVMTMVAVKVEKKLRSGVRLPLFIQKIKTGALSIRVISWKRFHTNQSKIRFGCKWFTARMLAVTCNVCRQQNCPIKTRRQ